jgi:CDP-glucose 4,6-dehydratase
LASQLHHKVGDVRDASIIKEWLNSIRPDVVYHLAAQPLVRRSYREAHRTWETNVMGTVNLLEAVCQMLSPCAVVVITTDKVYENREWNYAYREVDLLGGHDPYSSSKAATELAVASWRSSYFMESKKIRIASARAGNVIGGGDWSEDRIIPDFVRSLSAGKSIEVRNPEAVRPWQHVLEPLSGYLKLAEKLLTEEDPIWQSAFNFGPEAGDFRRVKDLVEEALQYWPGSWQDESDSEVPHEANFLTLTIEKARQKLGWHPRWDFHTAVQHTLEWYLKVQTNQASAEEICRQQIQLYEKCE